MSPVDRTTLNQVFDSLLANDTDVIQVSEAWVPHVERMMSEVHDALTPEMRTSFEWRQIKQKFGSMRAHYRCDMDVSAIMRPIIDEYATILDRVCEKCGAEGRLWNSGFWQVLCDQCAADGKREFPLYGVVLAYPLRWRIRAIDGHGMLYLKDAACAVYGTWVSPLVAISDLPKKLWVAYDKRNPGTVVSRAVSEGYAREMTSLNPFLEFVKTVPKAHRWLRWPANARPSVAAAVKKATMERGLDADVLDVNSKNEALVRKADGAYVVAIKKLRGYVLLNAVSYAHGCVDEAKRAIGEYEGWLDAIADRNKGDDAH